ncbi:hypothetical protein [uncultured Exiguobacterium sp.]|uniref:hypothetical protein n=1 Tax=uncultured Exiguobacterium sp. TaxID=202669 RepID=UPI0025E3534D|nr:hypothetical protein [uncultured Exiguobacterium sp.]
MQIDYFAVQPSGPKGALEAHMLYPGWNQRQNEEWERAVHYGAGLIRIRQRGTELRIPIEFGFGYVLQYIRQFMEAERKGGSIRQKMQAQLDWIAEGLPVRFKRDKETIVVTAERSHAFAERPFLEALGKSMYALP